MMRRSKYLALACVFALAVCPVYARGQQEMRSATKGSSTPLPITGTVIDADHNGLDVNIVGGSAGGSGGGDGAILDGASSAIKATVKDYTNSNPLTTIIVDTNGDPAVIGGGTQYDEDAAETAGGKLSMAGTVRRDTAASSAGTTGDNATLNTDSIGRLWSRPTGAVTPAASFANPTDAITVWSLNGCHNGTTWDPCTKSTAGNGAVDASTQRVTLANDSTGVLATVSNVATIGTSITPGTSAAHLGKAEDAAHTSGDTGVMLLGVRHDTATTGLGVDGDYAAIGLSSGGRVWTSATIDAALPAGSNTIGALTANQSVNVAQINGVTPLMGAGATGTGAQRVNPVSSSATGAAPPASASFIGGLGSGATGGFLIGPAVADTFKSVSVTSATTTLLVTGVSGRRVRITSINLLTAIANNVALISGTGATCGTGTAGIAGGTTAANGWNFAANGGLTMGNGIGTIMQTAATGDSVCIITSAAGPLAGSLSYAIY